MVEVPAALVAALLAFASAVTGMPVPYEATPKIELVDVTPSGRRLCVGCAEAGLTTLGGDIYLLKSWSGTREQNCLLAHELTHYLQVHHHRGAETRPIEEVEREAYTVTLACSKAYRMTKDTAWAEQMVLHPHVAK